MSGKYSIFFKNASFFISVMLYAVLNRARRYTPLSVFKGLTKYFFFFDSSVELEALAKHLDH